MGEYADDAIDAGFAEWGGIEGDEDEDEFAWIHGTFVYRGRRCKYCGERGLEWGQNSGKWRLFKNGEIHSCLKGKTP